MTLQEKLKAAAKVYNNLKAAKSEELKAYIASKFDVENIRGTFDNLSEEFRKGVYLRANTSCYEFCYVRSNSEYYGTAVTLYLNENWNWSREEEADAFRDAYISYSSYSSRGEEESHVMYAPVFIGKIAEIFVENRSDILATCNAIAADHDDEIMAAYGVISDLEKEIQKEKEIAKIAQETELLERAKSGIEVEKTKFYFKTSYSRYDSSHYDNVVNFKVVKTSYSGKTATVKIEYIQEYYNHELKEVVGERMTALLERVKMDKVKQFLTDCSPLPF